MPSADSARRSWAILFARGILGLIFFMAGVYKVFTLTPVGHAHKWFVDPYADTFLPMWSLWLTGVTIPVVELVTFGHLLKEPLYEFHTHVIPRLALLLFVLMLPAEADGFSMDAWLARRGRS